MYLKLTLSKMNIARKILAKGMSVQDVNELTGLTIEVIKSLNKDEKPG